MFSLLEKILKYLFFYRFFVKVPGLQNFKKIARWIHPIF